VGEAISFAGHGQVDVQVARERLRDCVTALSTMIESGYFDSEADTCGYEVELDLVDPLGRPRLVNRPVLAAIHRTDVQAELSRFNLELNLEPRPIRGQMLTTLESELAATLRAVDAVTREWGGRVIAIGTLPSLHAEDLTSERLSDSPRYPLLDAVMAEHRARAITLDIDGLDPLQVETDSIGVQGAATSFQVHVRVAPDEFARFFNAAQAVAPAQLAAGPNSPFLLGHRLWHETRIPLIEQSLDVRGPGVDGDREPPRVWLGDTWVATALDVLADNVHRYPPLVPVADDEDPLDELAEGRVPGLHELRLHNGTIWRWNRQVYDVQHGHPHLRIENRVVPSGPTAADMTANAAFFLGALRGLADLDPPVHQRLDFNAVRQDLHSAARWGPDAVLHDPTGGGVGPAVRILRDTLLPLAFDGLRGWGISSDDADRYLGIIEARVSTRRTGARWQLATVEALETGGLPREAALREMVRRYVTNARTDRPVHEWPI
jgi:gamma-glutamyl:cysteine ligase YbdK (ATP-grasp superfamily)